MPVEPLHPGDPLHLGPYRLGARLGAGGMGVVYLADSSRGPVAVKTLRRELADQPELRARFAREIAVLRQVGGACTVRVLDANMNMLTPYLVTEYVPGPTLEGYVAANGPLPEAMQQPLAVGLAEALVAIHAAGVVHRDLKPANVILGPQGPKVIDFGIAQLADAVSLTRAGLIVGSASFMAPEQVKGHPGTKADIFTWGLTVAFACRGGAPFGDGPPEAVLYRTMNEEPDLSGVSGELAAVLKKALVKDPENRPGAAEVLAELTGADAGPPDGKAAEDTSEQARELISRTWAMPAPPFIRPPLPVQPPPPAIPPPPPVRGAPPPRPPSLRAPVALPTGPRPPLSRPPGRQSLWLPVAILCGGLIVAAALTIGGLVAFNHGSSGAPPTEPSPAATHAHIVAPDGGQFGSPDGDEPDHRKSHLPTHTAAPGEDGGSGGENGSGQDGGNGSGEDGPSAAPRRPGSVPQFQLPAIPQTTTGANGVVEYG